MSGIFETEFENEELPNGEKGETSRVIEYFDSGGIILSELYAPLALSCLVNID
jgi:hypothetical protein